MFTSNLNLHELRRRHAVQNRFFIAVVYLLDPRNWSLSSSKTSWRTTLTIKNLTGYPPPPPTLETSWLDGLRGIAAFLVMMHHYGWDLYWYTTYEAPYGASMLNPQGQPFGAPYRQFWRLPFLRIFICSGHTQVSVFFVLSGFVLSWGTLGSIQKGDSGKVVGSLASATLRRWMRLYLPCFAVAFFGCVQVYMGWTVTAATVKESFFAQVWDWFLANDAFGNFTKLHRVDFATLHAYNYVMWTIPLEFEGSMLVFVLLLALSKVRQFWKRTMVIVFVAIYSYYKAHWTYWLFSSGVLLANYVRWKGGFKKLGSRQTWISTSAWCIVLVIALLLMGNPQKSSENLVSRPGYEWLDHWVPFDWLENEQGSRLWFSWSGLLFVTSAIHLPPMQRVYNMRFPRYLGHFSFMLYITHKMTAEMIGKPVRLALYRLFSRGNYINEMAVGSQPGPALSTFFIYVILMLIQIPAALFVAHWVTGLVDEPVVKLAKLVESWLTQGNGSHGEAGLAETDTEVLPLHSSSGLLERQELGQLPVLITNENEDDEYKEGSALLATQVSSPEEAIPQRRKEDDFFLV